MTNQPAEIRRGPELDRAVAAAAEYDALQGFAWMVIGGGLVLAAATPGQAAVYLALGAAFAGLVPSWYHRRFGLARPTRERSVRLGIGSAVALVLLLAAYAVDRALQPPVLVTMLTLALVLGVGQHLMLRRTGLTGIHRAVYALVAVAAAGPLVGWGRGDALAPYGLAIAGLALLVTGLVDHVRLVRILGPATDPATADGTGDVDDER